MNDAIKLIGIVIVVIGFVMKFDTLATVVVAGLVTGLISGMSIMDILNTLGTAFLTNRTATLFILTLPPKAFKFTEKYTGSTLPPLIIF